MEGLGSRVSYIKLLAVYKNCIDFLTSIKFLWSWTWPTDEHGDAG